MDNSCRVPLQSLLSTWKIVYECTYLSQYDIHSFRCVRRSLKDSCSPGSLSAVQTPVGCLQPWSLPRGNGWGLGLELFKAPRLCFQCPWWNHFKFYNCSNLSACSQGFFCFFVVGFGLVVCTNDKSIERRRKEERYKPSVRGKEISWACKNITVDKTKRENIKKTNNTNHSK